MKQERFRIGEAPVILLGEPSDRVYLFVHGQGGRKEEAYSFAEIAALHGWQVLAMDLPEHGERTDQKKFIPQEAVTELGAIGGYAQSHWKQVALRANSIGAWFSLLAFQEIKLEKCLMVSPVLDMEQLILTMLEWASVTEEQLHKEKEIPTNFGQTLSWDYLVFVRSHPITRWEIPTRILYGTQDTMISRNTVDRFVRKYGSQLTLMEMGEHWFHTDPQLQVLHAWEATNL